jgi:hypothetical protein
MKSVSAPSYAVDRYMVHPYTVTPGKVGPDVGNLGQRGYYEMWHDDIVEAADHHWLLPTSILEYEKCLSSFICCGYTVTLAKLAQILVIWGQCGYDMMA